MTLRNALCCLVASLLASVAQAEFRLEEIASGVFVHPGRTVALDAAGHDDIANIGFVVGDRCVAVIDTGGSMQTGRALRAAVKRKTSLPVCYVINTHDHVDHVLGNAAFLPEHPVFVGSAALPAAIVRDRNFFLRTYSGDLDAPASTDQIVAPSDTVATTRELDLGRRTLMLRAWPKAHTDCDLTVYDTTSGTLWTGDLLFVDRVPALDGSVKGWLAAIDALGAQRPAHVVPGHGPVGRDLSAMLAPEKRYLRTLADGVRAALAAGQSLDDATRHVGVDEKSHWRLFDTAHPRNVSRAYQELEWE